MAPVAYQTSVCYEGGMLGYMLVWWLAAWIPYFLWWALYGRLGDRSMRLYFLVYYNTYLPVWIVAILLRDVVIRSPSPNPSCNKSPYSMPSTESVLLAQYYTMGALHHWYFGIVPSWAMVARTLFSIVFLVGMFVWSGYYTFGDLLAGLGIGAGFGLFISYHLYDIWVPRFPFLAASKYLSVYLGFCDLYVGVHPLTDEEKEKWSVL